MSDLTIKELQAKVEQVTKDIETLRLTGDASRKLEVLTEYKTYLEDEIKFLKNESHNQN